MNRIFDLLAALIVAVVWPLMRAADATVCAWTNLTGSDHD